MTKLNDRPSVNSHEQALQNTDAFADAVLRGMKQAVRDAITDHHRAGNPVAIWREGKVVLWYPDGTYPDVEESDGEPVTADSVQDAAKPLANA